MLNGPLHAQLAVLPEHLQRQLSAPRGCRGRYAPSPTGRLHLGNLRTALVSWLITRLQGGEWLLRIDDLDTPRNRPGAEASILRDLTWLGLGWDGPLIRQSERRGLYASVLSSLRRTGQLYPCRCSRRMLADISAPHGTTPVYPGWCREGGADWGLRDGRLPSWRLQLNPGSLCWPEPLATATGGQCCLDAQSQVGDVVLRRADGFIAYHLATAVDELALGISDVVRGDDLVQATAPQLAVMQALEGQSPRYWHLPLWRDGDGRRLSKRDGGLDLDGLRAQGLDAAAVVGRMAATLTLVNPGSRLSSAELLQALSLDQLVAALAVCPA